MRRADSSKTLLCGFFRGLFALASLCCALMTRVAHADDLRDFEAARTLYDQQDYAKAVDALRALVGTDPPRLADPLLVLESRKYLAASLLFMGAAEDAKTQFRMLLTQEPDYALDPLAFPTEVLSLFEQVRAELRRSLDEQRRAEEAKRRDTERKARAAEQLQRANLSTLRAFALESEVRTQNSRWVASVPFGVGQFQNGHKGLGVALAMGQGISAATSVVSYVAHERMVNDRPGAAEVGNAERIEAAWRTTNLVSFSVFAALAVIGIIDAHVRFVPERVTSRPRQLPPDLDRWVREQGLSSGIPALRF